jgi:glycosyltransferase involved in cell wall biosynthesis
MKGKNINKKDIKIGFFHPKGASFCSNDKRLLMKHYTVTDTSYSWSDLKSIIFLPIEGLLSMLRSDISISWFGSLHALIAVFWSKILNKKSIVIAGGYDVVSESEIDYGLLNRKFLKWIPILVFRNCDQILAVSLYTKDELLRNTTIPSDKISIVYNCIDTSEYQPPFLKENIVITIGAVNEVTLIRKGIHDFIEISKLLPDYKFICVGKISKAIKDQIATHNSSSSNLSFTGFISDYDKVSLLRKSKVYAQLSYHEGFGVSVAEAMACECIPVVTKKGALPEVVGDSGYCVEYGDYKAIANAIENAMGDDTKGPESRKRAISYFDLHKREEQLINTIEDLLIELE